MVDCETKMQMPHAILIPFPIQGHINPMMQLALKLISHGFIITFVNTEFNYQRIIQANNYKFTNPCCNMLRMISVPDGLPPQDSRKDFVKLLHALESSMSPSVVHKLLQETNEKEEKHKVTCIIADYWICCGLSEMARVNSISLAAFHASLVSICAIRFFSFRLISLGILPPDGIPTEDTIVKYLPSLPLLHSSYLPWRYGGEYLFQFAIRVGEELRRINWILFNSVYELEAPVVDELSKEVRAYPIGPLIASNRFLESGNSPQTEVTTSLWADELECLEWLDKQCAQSVIYVSFGSLVVFIDRQIEELALGLEATQRPFLWVVRSDLVVGGTASLPSGFLERIEDRGCIVSWAPQSRVLSHPSVACFVTHCGWNSTEESIMMGVPMLCLPSFADQFVNLTYIVDVWKIGLGLEANKDGIIDKVELARAVRRLLVDEEGMEIRKEVDKWKMTARNAVKKGGSSSNNFNIFINAIKEKLSATWNGKS